MLQVTAELEAVWPCLVTHSGKERRRKEEGGGRAKQRKSSKTAAPLSPSLRDESLIGHRSIRRTVLWLRYPLNDWPWRQPKHTHISVPLQEQIPPLGLLGEYIFLRVLQVLRVGSGDSHGSGKHSQERGLGSCLVFFRFFYQPSASLIHSFTKPLNPFVRVMGTGDYTRTTDASWGPTMLTAGHTLS